MAGADVAESRSGASSLSLYKWLTFASMYMGYSLAVLNRKCFSFALPAIIGSLHLAKDDVGEDFNHVFWVIMIVFWTRCLKWCYISYQNLLFCANIMLFILCDWCLMSLYNFLKRFNVLPIAKCFYFFVYLQVWCQAVKIWLTLSANFVVGYCLTISVQKWCLLLASSFLVYWQFRWQAGFFLLLALHHTNWLKMHWNYRTRHWNALREQLNIPQKYNFRADMWMTGDRTCPCSFYTMRLYYLS